MAAPVIIGLALILTAHQCLAASIHRCCAPDILVPSIFGAEIQHVEALPVYNYSRLSIAMNDGDPAYSNTNITTLNFCNVTVTYTHPGRQDTLHVTTWLPFRRWNGRFQGTGGDGFLMSTGDAGLAPVVAQGYAAAKTNGGHGETLQDGDPKHWALLSPGNVNLGLLQDFSSTALNDMAIIGKAVTASFYGQPPKFSYWNGCSTGGRQGLMLAQRYPDAYDGILASAPLVNRPKTPMATYWAQQIMNELDYYPPRCEMEAITAEAVQACDELDNVNDGIISLPSLCKFDARQIIGKPFDACGTNRTFSPQAATIANAAWSGPHSPEGKQLWYGLNKDADLMGVANTTCSGQTAGSCKGNPFFIGTEWIQYFLVKDPALSFANLNSSSYAQLFHLSVQEYQSTLGTADPDLSRFRERGGKMISIHGMADPVVPLNSTVEYYRSVLSLDPQAADYYRLFEAPGGGHCNTYKGPYPRETFHALEQWVEHGNAPETLKAVDPTGKIVRPLCPFPLVQRYKGGDPDIPDSFACM